MFSAFVGEAMTYFGKGFLLAVWMPVFFTSAAIGTTLLITVDKLDWTLWNDLDKSQQIVVGFIALVAITTLSFFLHHLQVPITRLFEGYWVDWPIVKRLKRYKKARYCARFHALEKTLSNLGNAASSDMTKLAWKTEIFLRQYPPKHIEGLPYDPMAYIMPTQLGNIYRSAELYSLARYGLESTLFWPHLIEVIPESFLQRLQDLKIAVDFWLLSSLLLMLYAATTVISFIFLKTSAVLILLFLMALLLSYGCYRTAITPALAYGVLIRVAFDLYRRPLLEKLGCPLPATLSEEKKLWKHLQFFMYNGAPTDQFIKLLTTEQA